jgi:hypothetical protein
MMVPRSFRTEILPRSVRRLHSSSGQAAHLERMVGLEPRIKPLPRGGFGLNELLDDNCILALDEAAGILLCPDMPENDVALLGAEKWNPGAD